ncbi:RNA polymerase RpoE-like sigma-24 subunit [Desulfitobacterium sp. LBE]|uniref:RNA polymerase sigma factor n=5 Tax=root TaxID=1 RepID=Q24V24_DESHY|nr:MULTISPECIES: sigma-70 family RNA polymerase sigma factor [Desulfitobacterium]ACL21486.1 RNA polymerase, sigma-24 subunit, ECF subfamily [Desulfitobacterium hafniense DCB-2]EHL07610.1 methyltransferase domain protein [Desulfitobacterium hafniense DP7]KTE89840.1 methyltransferase [Desulfitobacterium hafniense]MEA5023178.1 sigma-70 family RNA polymerase sigma factor [Desulfitobacterium hafniense]TWH60727.1 RNA polymerase RpoE-like sigma-24 subunit [Desulfitobacterium sp. LBE]
MSTDLAEQPFKFDDVFMQYYPCIYNFIRWLIQDEDCAQDLAQETFLRAFVNLGTRSEHNLSPWLHTIARNLCHDYWRKNKRRGGRELLLQDAFECEDESSKPLAAIENKETAKQIYKILNLLKSEQRTALLLREIEGLSYDDAARVMGISVSAYTSLLNRARNKFIKLIMTPYTKINKGLFTPKEYTVLYRWFGIDAWPEDPEQEIVHKAKHYFDNSALSFDEFRNSLYPFHLDQAILNRVLNKDPQIIGDFGSGTGQFTLKAASSVNLEKTYAFDISPKMVDFSQQRFKREGLRHIQCLPADLNSIPLESETLDIGYCLVVLHHLYDPGKAIKEMTRTLKPGGQLIIGDFGSHNYNLFTKNNKDLWSGFSPDQMTKWFNEAGLENIDIREEKDCIFKSTTQAGELVKIPLLMSSGIKRA